MTVNFTCNFFPLNSLCTGSALSKWPRSGPTKTVTARDATGFYTFFPPGNRVIFSRFWWDAPTKSNNKPGETKEKYSPKKTIKSSGDGAALKLKISVPCRFHSVEFCEPSRELQESLGPLRARNPQKVLKKSPGASGPRVPPKVWKKSRKCPKSLGKVSKMSVRDFFETFSRLFGTPGPEALGDFFQTFWARRGPRDSRSSSEGSQVEFAKAQEGTNVQFSNVHFVLCQIVGLGACACC